MAKVITVYVHAPRVRGDRSIVFVTRVRKDWHQHGNSKKQVLDDWFMIDMPGTWFDDAYNCHVDGCDHACASLEEAVAKGVWVYDTKDPVTGEYPVYEFRKVARPFEWSDIQPESYNLEQAPVMEIDYPMFKAAFNHPYIKPIISREQRLNGKNRKEINAQSFRLCLRLKYGSPRYMRVNAITDRYLRNISCHIIGIPDYQEMNEFLCLKRIKREVYMRR